jgi:hypothetical protein
MLGHRSRPWQCILRAEPLPGDGLRDGRRKLEYPQPAETLSAQLLERFRGTAAPPQPQPPRRGVSDHAHAWMWLEGIVSKRKDSAYRSGRSRDWLKMKNPACAAVTREAEEDWAR